MRRDLTLDDLGDLVELRLMAVLATYRREGTVLLSPVWHEWRDGRFHVATSAYYGGRRGPPVTGRAVTGRRRGKRGSYPGLPGRSPAPGEVAGGDLAGTRGMPRRRSAGVVGSGARPLAGGGGARPVRPGRAPPSPGRP